MLVRRSSIIGYCYGVSNTIKKAEECLALAKEKNLPCYSIGNLIHNNDVVSYFEEKGLRTITIKDDVPPGVALIRAHGIRDCTRRKFLNEGFELIDSTCPTVLKGTNALRKAAKEQKTLILLGFEDHAETVGLQGIEEKAGVPIKTTLISSLEEAQKLVASKEIDESQEVFVVTQTTFPVKLYESITDLFKKSYKNIGFGNKPCPFCEKREQVGYELTCQCDCAVVVGGRGSANTKNLAEVAAKSGKPVFQVENTADFDEALKEKLAKFEAVALLSGSSTPMQMVERVARLLEAL